MEKTKKWGKNKNGRKMRKKRRKMAEKWGKNEKNGQKIRKMGKNLSHRFREL